MESINEPGRVMPKASSCLPTGERVWAAPCCPIQGSAVSQDRRRSTHLSEHPGNQLLAQLPAHQADCADSWVDVQDSGFLHFCAGSISGGENRRACRAGAPSSATRRGPAPAGTSNAESDRRRVGPRRPVRAVGEPQGTGAGPARNARRFGPRAGVRGWCQPVHADFHTDSHVLVLELACKQGWEDWTCPLDAVSIHLHARQAIGA